MDETTSPLVPGLSWTVAMSDDACFYRQSGAGGREGGGVKQSFVGLLLMDKGVLRNHLRVVTGRG